MPPRIDLSLTRWLRHALRNAVPWLKDQTARVGHATRKPNKRKDATDAAQRGFRWARAHPQESAGIALVLMGVVGLFGYLTFKRPGDVYNAGAIFGTSLGINESSSSWPLYGHDQARTKFSPAKGVDPPFHKKWRFGAQELLEFPPVFADGGLYFMNNPAEFFAVDANTGKLRWKRKIGSLSAGSPAYDGGKLFGVTLEPGQAFSLDASTGRTLWKLPLPGRSESSPVVANGRVYFGCENGQLFAVDAGSGKIVWRTQLGGAIKAAPALSEGVLYVGDYGGQMSAVKASNGKIVWKTGSQGSSFGRSGEFYSTAAVAFGRVYAGNNDGRIYSFEKKSGKLAWSQSLGGYVYSGPAVSDTSNSGPTVYVGSFDSRLHALDARTGNERWSADAGGRVSGAIVVIDHTVYVSNVDTTETRGFDTKTHRKVFDISSGAYTPGLTDGHTFFFTGYSTIQALTPK